MEGRILPLEGNTHPGGLFHGREYSDAGIGKRFRGAEPLGLSHGDDGCIAAQEGKGRTQECRDLHLGKEMEKDGAQTCEKQGGAHGKAGNDRDQHRGSEHGEHVLEAQGEHFARSKGTGIIDSLLLFGHVV